ncbi:MAG: YceI family protein [Pseudolysinimonas sp.]
MTGTGSDEVAQLLPPGSYLVDPIRSSVRYAGRHMFGLGAVQATFDVVSGSIEVAESTSASVVRLSVDPATFTSDKPRRDEHVKSKALLDVEQYPEISFRSTAVRADGDQWRLMGDVTAHGSTQPVQITVDRATASGMDITIHAVAQLDRYAFGVTGVKGMAGRQVNLEFDLIVAATTSSAGSP